eukprot:1157752-Pelagomonas_calceolata.AAC.7
MPTCQAPHVAHTPSSAHCFFCTHAAHARKKPCFPIEACGWLLAPGTTICDRCCKERQKVHTPPCTSDVLEAHQGIKPGQPGGDKAAFVPDLHEDTKMMSKKITKASSLSSQVGLLPFLYVICMKKETMRQA